MSGAVLLLAVLALAGCGGSGSKPPAPLRGDGYGFSAPGGWKVSRSTASVAAADGTEAVSVTTYRLTRTYRPALRRQAVKELDRVAGTLAAQLGGKVIVHRVVTVAGMPARQYDIAFTRKGKALVERITFVLHGRREYELLCRFEEGKDEPACALLERSFRLDGG